MGNYRPAHGYSAHAFVAAVAAGTATREDPVFVAPVKCRITRFSVVPQAASTGDNTNRKDLNFKNKGSAGAGTTVIAHLDLMTGVNLVAFDEKEIPLETGDLDGPELAEGETITLETEQVGTGVAVGPFLVNLEYIPV